MKEIIEEFKRTNGNVSFSNKEILMYIAGRLDKLNEKIEDLSYSLVGVKRDVKYHWIAITILGSIVAFIITKVVIQWAY